MAHDYRHHILGRDGTGQSTAQKLIEGTQFRLVALVDRRDIPSPFPEIPLLIGEAGLDNWLQWLAAGPRPAAAVTIGGDRGKDRIGLRLTFEARGMATPTLVHRTAFVARNAAIGAASQNYWPRRPRLRGSDHPANP